MDRIKEWQSLSERFSLIPVAGKVPIDPGWQQWCVTKRVFNAEHFKGKNAGVACGPASQVLVLDVDDEEAFYNQCCANGWDMPDTMTVTTGSGRPHYYFTYPMNGNEYGCTAYKVNGKQVFDVRASGG